MSTFAFLSCRERDVILKVGVVGIGNMHGENDNRVHFGEKVSRFVCLQTRWNRFENNITIRKK